MKIKNILIKAFLISTVLLGMQSCGGKQGGVRTLKLAHTLNTQHSVHKAMLLMAEKVKEKSGGKLELEVYHSAQLGTESQCLELLQIGSLAMTKVSAAVMESFAPSYKVLGLPYIFKNKEHMFNVQDGPIGKKILQDGEEAWLRGLCFFDAGSRSFYTKSNPIESPDDLKGLKIRVMKSITANKMVSAMGAAPMPISFGELYTALQQGVVDGAENNPPSFYLSKHYEVCKYYSIDEHSSVPDVLLISTVIWDRLSDEEKTWIQEAANECVPAQRKFWEESEAESLKAVQEAGVKVNYPKKEPFSERVSDMYDSYKSDPKIYNLIQEIRALD
ncbi:TRAP transporter substrate-binding protein [Flexithrix dorotheae]|uniref:TRAP transporter substrate-binding protein n=1 Tax=Flexithrix dorotheae TaxID=70993 RepID=UPI000370FDED|nr:TRAP transporter substrate-binding protein [Flexithrix dorotheae]